MALVFACEDKADSPTGDDLGEVSDTSEDDDGDGAPENDGDDGDDAGDDTGSSDASEDCSNGVDDDDDGLVDCEDGECAGDGACVEDCEDGQDNDGDGLTDCEDHADCAGTEACPIHTQVTLTGGEGYFHRGMATGGDYLGAYLFDLSGTVSTFDSSASTWRSCAWRVGTVFAYDPAPSAPGLSLAPQRFDTSVGGSCGLGQVSSFLPGSLRIDESSSPRIGRLSATTAMGSTAASWYRFDRGTLSATSDGDAYWRASGALHTQTIWLTP